MNHVLGSGSVLSRHRRVAIDEAIRFEDAVTH
jgi:hypothetical protein